MSIIITVNTLHKSSRCKEKIKIIHSQLRLLKLTNIPIDLYRKLDFFFFIIPTNYKNLIKL